MNGAQDLGGQHGMGPVAPEKDEPYFHAEWEKRALGLTLSCGAFGAWTIDESRHARESLPPATYLSASYYEIWTRALEALLKRHGFISAAELAAGQMLEKGREPKRILTADMVPAVLAKGGPCDRPLALSLPSASGCARKTSIRKPTQGCRAMPAPGRGSSRRYRARSSFPTTTRTARVKTRNGFIPLFSMPVKSGARAPTRR